MDSPEKKEKHAPRITLPSDFRPLMEKLPIGILVHVGGTILYVNQTLGRMLGVNAPELTGQPATDLFAKSSKHFLFQSTSSHPSSTVEAELLTGNHTLLAVEISHSETEWEHNRLHILAIKDVTQRKHEEELVRRQANFDTLTGIPNRALFMDRLNQELMRAKRIKSHLALMFIDLDRFKWVNDTLGHAAGDALLREASQRLISCHRKTDTVARLGGDEFTVILPDINKGPYAERVCRSILSRLTEPFLLEGQEVFISGSIGVTVYPDDADNLQDLLKNADTAMYRAKADGRNTFRFFTHEMHAQAMERVLLEKDLHRAVEHNLLTIHYQPIFHVTSQTLVGAEAFLRWEHPVRGMIPPDMFIPLAEEIGISNAITEWTLQTACEQAKAWRTIAGLEGFNISINLTCYRCRDLSQGNKIRNIVEGTGLPPAHLILEITENILSENENAALDMLSALRDFGIALWLDDFGTGQSSLRVLKRLPLNGIKIDRMFIQDISIKPESAVLVEIILGLARNLNLQVVGEGVETIGQHEFLGNRGCHLAQGYLYGRPMPAAQFEAFLHQWLADHTAAGS